MQKGPIKSLIEQRKKTGNLTRWIGSAKAPAADQET